MDIAGGLQAGSGNVDIIDSTGKIPAISSTYFADLSGANLTALNAGNISSGTLADARLSSNVTVQGNTFNGVSQLVQTDGTGALPTLSGANLTSLNASNISSGTLADARLSAAAQDAITKRHTQNTDTGTTSTTFTLQSGGIQGILTAASLATTNKTFTLPNVNGTFITSGNLTDITSVGTIASGTWQGSAIGAQYGGTGLNTSASTGVPSISSGTWSVAASLAATLGGTGQTGYTTGDLLYASNATTLAKRTIGSEGEVLKVVSGVPTWATDTSSGGTVTSIDSGSGLTGGPITGTGSLSVGQGLGISVTADAVAIDTAVVPQLSSANTFSGSNSFGDMATDVTSLDTAAVTDQAMNDSSILRMLARYDSDAGVGTTTAATKAADMVHNVTAQTGASQVDLSIGGSGVASFMSTGKLDISGGLQAGSGNVEIIDSTGKIPGISSTYFADLSGANLTSLNASSISSGTLADARLSSNVTVQGNTFNGVSQLVQTDGTG
ncbi:MAG: hypothetical protein AAB281_02210, partial [Actinomycetota bacterium]